MVGAQHPEQRVARDVVRQHPEVVDRCPRRVREVRDPQVRAQASQLLGEQGEVVVLHQHLGALGGLGRQRLGERLVVGLVGRPLAAEPGVERRCGRHRVEQVVDEPQGGVRDRVVRAVEGRRVDVEHPDRHAAGVVAVAVQPAVLDLAGSGAVAVGQRRADPDDVVAAEPGQPRHQAATAAAGRQGPVVTLDEGQRSAVGRDEQRGRAGRCHEPHLPAARGDQATRRSE